MPELPEVEVLRRSLEPRLVGRRVEAVEVANGDLRTPISGAVLSPRLVGREVEALGRRAKYLLIQLTDGETLVVHLGMSGRLELVRTRAAAAPHEHVSIFLDREERLAYRDPRRFGLVLPLETAALDADERFRHLGLEPLSAELTGERLSYLARGRRGPVKNFLMNGRIVVGVGNIYATEALFEAGIHPRRSVARIGADRWQRLAETVQAVLGSAIEQGGTTLNDFRDGDGQPGYFQVSLAAYGREGEPCRRCSARLRRIVQAGRSTFYCPGCQH